MIPIQHRPNPTLSRRMAAPISRVALSAMLLAAASSSAAERTYQYFRFETIKLNAADLIQLAEFTVSSQGSLLNLNNRNGTGVNIVNVTASSLGQGIGGEDPPKAVDGDINTKWLRANPLVRENGLVLDFGVPVTIDAYNFATANDSQAFGRTPVSWSLSGSTNGIDWTILDVRQNVPIVNQNFTYQAGFTIPEQVPQIISLFDVDVAPVGGHSAVVVNGGQIPLIWNSQFGDTVTLAGGTESFVVADVGVKNVTPPANATTDYTLTVAKAGNDDATESLTLRTVVGGPSTYRYVRYRITQRRPDTAGLVQVSEFQFYNGDSTVPANRVVVTDATNPGGSNGPDAGEGVLKLIDGDINTKWLDGNNQPVIFDFGSAVTFDRYLFVTGNDATDRDPVMWTLEGSDDLDNWTAIENIDFNYPTPLGRNVSSLGIPLPGPSLTPIIDVFTGNSARLVSGQSLTLIYSTFGATLLKLNGSPLAMASGEVVVSPTVDTIYSLTAEGPNGLGVATATFAVNVIPDTGVNSIAYNNFATSGPEIILNGNASIAGSRLRLTPAIGSQLGGAWFINKIDTSGGFEATFGLSLNQDAPSVNIPADGLSFIVQNSPMGTTLTGNGETGLAQNALNIMFKSYGFDAANASLMEVRDGNVVIASRVIYDTPGIKLFGVPGVLNPVTGVYDGKSVFTIGELASNPPYRIRIVYVPGSLDVYFDGIAIAQNVDVDLQEIGAADASGKSYFGFSGRTGGNFQNNDITDWYVNLGNFSALPPFGLVKSLFRTTEGSAKPDMVDLVWNAGFDFDYEVMRSVDLVNWETIDTVFGENGQLGIKIDNSAYGPEKAFFRVEQVEP